MMFAPITPPQTVLFPRRSKNNYPLGNIKKKKNRTSSFAQGNVAMDDAWPVVRQASVANHIRAKKEKEDRGGLRTESVEGERGEEKKGSGGVRSGEERRLRQQMAVGAQVSVDRHGK